MKKDPKQQVALETSYCFFSKCIALMSKKKKKKKIATLSIISNATLNKVVVFL